MKQVMRSAGVAAIAAALALLACGTVRAEWLMLGAEEGIYSAYGDPDTISRVDGKVRMQGLYDFPNGDFTPDGRELHSTRVTREYDCDARRVRLLGHVDHAGHMSEGAAVAIGVEPGRWESVIAASLDERFWNMACRAR